MHVGEGPSYTTHCVEQPGEERGRRPDRHSPGQAEELLYKIQGACTERTTQGDPRDLSDTLSTPRSTTEKARVSKFNSHLPVHVAVSLQYSKIPPPKSVLTLFLYFSCFYVLLCLLFLLHFTNVPRLAYFKIMSFCFP